MRSVGTTSADFNMKATGGGYVVVPFDVDRNKFVETCLRKGTISIMRDLSFGIINNVRVDRELIQEIEFPQEGGKLGSYVVFLSDFRKLPYVVGILNKDGNILQSREHQRLFQKKTENGLVSVSLDGREVKIDILAEGDQAEVNIDVRGGNANIRSDANVQITGADSVRLRSQTQVSLIFNDEESEVSVNVSKDLIKTNSPRIEHNEANEPMLRGQRVTDLLEKLIDLLNSARVATSIGLQPLTTAPQINQLKQDLEDLKSTKSFLE
jgi:hypothetical protein